MERRDRKAGGVSEGEVREARETRLVHMDHVEALRGEDQLEVRADAERNAQPASARDRDRRAERDDALEGSAVAAKLAKRAPARAELAGSIRGREHDDLMPAALELAGGACDVLVHGVRLRPRERGHEAD